jgi:hypothetical protein
MKYTNHVVQRVQKLVKMVLTKILTKRVHFHVKQVVFVVKVMCVKVDDEKALVSLLNNALRLLKYQINISIFFYLYDLNK